MFGRKQREIERLENVVADRDATEASLLDALGDETERVRTLVSAHQDLQASAIQHIEGLVSAHYTAIYDAIDYLTEVGIEDDMIFESLDRYLYGDGQREAARVTINGPS